MKLRQVPGLFFKAARKAVRHPAEAILLCRMAWWVSVLSVAVRVRPLPRALSIVCGPNETANGKTGDERVANYLARTVDQLLSIDLMMFRPICWKRATILRRYLSQNGISSHILFGVRNDGNGTVTGHAWLESKGMVILEKQPIDYVVTYTFPSNAPCNTELASFSSMATHPLATADGTDLIHSSEENSQYHLG
jgi:hypothetical protein